MSDSLNTAIVRIRDADQKVVGTGFLVSNRHVLTCAHVVDQAETPSREVHLDFPFLPRQPSVKAWVVSRQPGDRLTEYPPKDGLDIALLGLQKSRPDDSRPAPLVMPAAAADHRFKAYGFPSGHDLGLWIYGTLRDLHALGWGQLDPEPGSGSHFITPGCSGAAVWDDALRGVVGMIVAADKDTRSKAAFMIPTPMLLNAAAELAVSEVGRELQARNVCLLIKPQLAVGLAQMRQGNDMAHMILPAITQAQLHIAPGWAHGLLIDRITADYVKLVTEADIVVVDANHYDDEQWARQLPFLYYFLALRHARGNRTILVSRSNEHLPNDFRDRPHTLIYSDQQLYNFWQTFSAVVEQIRARTIDQVDNPVQQYERDRARDEELQRLTAEVAARDQWAKTFRLHLEPPASPPKPVRADVRAAPPRPPAQSDAADPEGSRKKLVFKPAGLPKPSPEKPT